MSQPFILRDEQSRLLMRIAAMGNVSLRADEKLTAFVELESAIQCGARLLI